MQLHLPRIAASLQQPRRRGSRAAVAGGGGSPEVRGVAGGEPRKWRLLPDMSSAKNERRGRKGDGGKENVGGSGGSWPIGARLAAVGECAPHGGVREEAAGARAVGYKAKVKVSDEENPRYQLYKQIV